MIPDIKCACIVGHSVGGIFDQEHPFSVDLAPGIEASSKACNRQVLEGTKSEFIFRCLEYECYRIHFGLSRAAKYCLASFCLSLTVPFTFAAKVHLLPSVILKDILIICWCSLRDSICSKHAATAEDLAIAN